MNKKVLMILTASAILFLTIATIVFVSGKIAPEAGSEKQTGKLGPAEPARDQKPEKIPPGQATEEIIAPDSTKRPVLTNIGRRFHTVFLGADGNLESRVRYFDPVGNLLPADVDILFAQYGRVIRAARSDESGRFQITRLKPGIYSVITAGRHGYGLFSVEVLKHDENTADRLLLDITVAPIVDSQLICSLLCGVPEEHLIEIEQKAPRRGLWGLLGLTGLIGKKKVPSTPFGP